MDADLQHRARGQGPTLRTWWSSGRGERLVLAEALREAVLPDAPVVAGPLPGSAFVGIRYEPLYPNVEGAHRVVPADFVSLEDGTGVVHLAPAFGPEDLEIGRREGWAPFKPLDGEGRFTDEAPALVRGEFFKDADDAIIADLRSRGLLLRAGTIVHAYPLCWRCDTPLIYIARSSWYVRTTAVKDRLLAVNEEVDWYPGHIKHGRYGDWLENNVDWALSRERYWGTPLPIWRCDQGHDTAIGSLRELSELARRDVTGLDPHRPAIDEVTVPCPTCGGISTRVPEVIDTWYDSGAMPYAQWGYHPEVGRGLELFRERFPADFIAEAIDQTRGWFYTLMAEGVLLFDATTYRTVVCLGHLVDRDGRKMSKSLGNTVDAFEVMDRQGADALRWFLLTGGSPWSPRRVSMQMFDDVVRQFLLPLWNVYAFFVTYANASGFDPSEGDVVPVAERPLLDRWVLSQLSRTETAARDGLEAYDATGAGRRIADFVDDLSNWYVRRARRRFWDPAGEGGDDVRAAFLTLHACLVSLSQLLAPFTPFVTETLWRNLAAGREGAPDSVHLSDYPTADERLVGSDARRRDGRRPPDRGARATGPYRDQGARSPAAARGRRPLRRRPRRPGAAARPGRRGAEREAGAVRRVRRAAGSLARQARTSGSSAPGSVSGSRTWRRRSNAMTGRSPPRSLAAGRFGSTSGPSRSSSRRPTSISSRRPSRVGGSRATAASPSRSSSSSRPSSEPRASAASWCVRCKTRARPQAWTSAIGSCSASGWRVRPPKRSTRIAHGSPGRPWPWRSSTGPRPMRRSGRPSRSRALG